MGHNNFHKKQLWDKGKEAYCSKSVTLVELALSIAFLSVIILAGVSFNYASSYFLESVRKKAILVNERALCLEYIAKYVSQAIGDATGDKDGSGIVVDSNHKWVNIRIDYKKTPSNYDDDKWVHFEFENVKDEKGEKKGDNYKMTFCSDWDDSSKSCKDDGVKSIITKKIVTNDKNPMPKFYLGSDNNVNELICSPFTLRYNPDKPKDIKKNPEIYMYDSVLFSSVSHSIN